MVRPYFFYVIASEATECKIPLRMRRDPVFEAGSRCALLQRAFHIHERDGS